MYRTYWYDINFAAEPLVNSLTQSTTDVSKRLNKENCVVSSSCNISNQSCEVGSNQVR